MAKLYTYMIGIEPSYWTKDDDYACDSYDVENKGYYKLGTDEGMILVGTLKNLKSLMDKYFGVDIVEDYLTPIDYFDFEDGEWISGGWKESKKSNKKSLKENINAFNKAIAKKYNGTEPDGAGQYYLDWRFDLKDEMDNIEMLADKYGVTVEFQSDDGYFEVFEESKKSVRKSLKERSEENEIIVAELQDTVEYFCGIYESEGELGKVALKDLKNAIERLEVFNAIGSIYQWGVEVLNDCGVRYKGL